MNNIIQIFFLLIPLLTTHLVNANSINVDLNASAMIHIQHIVKDDNDFLECGKRDPDRTDLDRTEIFESEVITKDITNTNATANVAAGYRSSHSTYWAKATGNMIEKNNMTTFTITLEDFVKNFHQDQIESCSHNHIYHTYQSGKVNAKFIISYKVPKNVWGVKIHEGNNNNVFTFDSESDQNILQGHNKTAKERWVWAEPGSEIKKIFTIKDFAQGTRVNSSYTISFEPLNKPLNSKNDVVKALNYIKAQSKTLTNKLKENEFQNFLIIGFSLLKEKDLLKMALDSYSTTELFMLSENLYKLANEKIKNDDIVLEAHVKTMAAVLSNEIGNIFIESMEPYCSVREVKLPYTSETINVLGIRYADFLMRRVIGQVESFSFEAHMSFLKKLKELQSQGYTYRNVLKNDELRIQMQKASRTLRKRAKLNERPFANAIIDLRQVYTVFKSFGTGAEHGNAILEQLTHLSELENSFTSQLLDHILNYSLDNNKNISIDHLVNMLDEISFKQAEVASRMTSHMRFLSIDGAAGKNSLVDLLTRVKTHQLNIIQNPSKLETFENVREKYLDKNRTDKNVETFYACIYEGVAK